MGPTTALKIANNSIYGLTPKEKYLYLMDYIKLNGRKNNMISTMYLDAYIDYLTYGKRVSYIYPNPTKFFYDPESGVAVIIWDDGDKTVVKPAKDENIDIYDSFCAAFCKKIYGTNSALKRHLNDILVIKEKKEKKKKK